MYDFSHSLCKGAKKLEKCEDVLLFLSHTTVNKMCSGFGLFTELFQDKGLPENNEKAFFNTFRHFTD